MKSKATFSGILVLIFAGSFLALQAQNMSHSGTAVLKPTAGNQAKGTVRFDEKGGKLHVVANVTGLTPGKHGFHVHEKGDCGAPDATSAGGHFNPEGHKHGAPDAAEHHDGDLGNIEADASGKAHYDRAVDFITLAQDPNSIAGKAVIIHAQPDDLQSQPVGNAGARVGCGIINKKN